MIIKPSNQGNASVFGSASVFSSPPPSSSTAFSFGNPASIKTPTSNFGSSSTTPYQTTNQLFAMGNAIYNSVFSTSFADKERALNYFKQAASLGHIEAQCKVGDLCREGYGTAQDFAQAIEWYTKAAANGNTLAHLNLGVLCEEGKGRLRNDYKGAYIHYLQAAERDNSEAIFRLGHLYHYGMGVQANLTQARTYYERAAKQGHVLGSFNAGYMYQFGLGAQPTSLFAFSAIDYGKAFGYYMQAAKENHPDALCNVGYLYEKGYGVILNYKQAFHHYSRGAEKGSYQAHQNLGELYMDGRGTNTDLDKAYHHFETAHQGGIEESQKYMDIIKEKKSDISGSGSMNGDYIAIAEHNRLIKEKDDKIAAFMEQIKLQQTQIDSLMGKLFST
ncbi:hypothetical protein [Parasitella parasitica]|uniref:Uncharacterized protein n=1 Tax=Parasitella parasitica TaxID=35722 RepID=A0A0B7NPX8_9FUNG|nr:hypothetical protein [Parasitella parasitica]